MLLGLLLGMSYWISFIHVRVAVLTESSSGVYLYTAAYGVSLGPVAWVLPNEVFPLSMRGKGAALSTASVWTNNCMFRVPNSLITLELLIDDDIQS